jgi:hypothetical protein
MDGLIEFLSYDCEARGKERCRGPRSACVAPLPAPLQPTSRRFRAELEAKHDSGRHSQIVLSLRVRGVELVKPRQQIIHLRGANRKVRANPIVHSAPHGHRKRILAVRGIEQVRAGVRYAEQHFTEWRHA